MTVKQLIEKLQTMPQSLPVYVESAPWGCPFEAEIVRKIEVTDGQGKNARNVVMVEHNVGF